MKDRIKSQTLNDEELICNYTHFYDNSIAIQSKSIDWLNVVLL
jgi:hypothetical protein